MAVDQSDLANNPGRDNFDVEQKADKASESLFDSVWKDLKESLPFTKTGDLGGQAPDVLTFNTDSLYKSVNDLGNKMKAAMPDVLAKTAAPADTADAQVGGPPTPIKRDIEPSEHVVKPGDNLTKIAKQQLGKDATPEEVQTYIKEIAKLNGIKNPDLILDGQKLQLPGHTADGGFVTKDADGNRTTTWEDGSVKVENKDGTGFEVKPGPSGELYEKSWGPKPSDNYEAVQKADGTVEKTDSKGTKTTTRPDGTVKVENKDGSGYDQSIRADGVKLERHFGSGPNDNYTLAQQPDGSFKGTDAAGNTHQRWNDGTEKFESQDGQSGYVKKTDADGKLTEQHWGPRPEDNFHKTTHPDGKVEVRDNPTGPVKSEVDAPELNKQREALKELAEKKITDPKERAKFEADMARLEARSKDMEDLYVKEGMSREDAQKKAQEQITETYKQVGKLLDAPDNPSLPKPNAQDRVHLAEQVMSQAGSPTSVDQGIHPTCNVATVEARTYTKNPAEAARMVTEVATTGEYKTRDGKTIKIDPGSLEPHDGATQVPVVDGQRSYASQIFQVTAVNIHYQRQDGDLRYEQRKPNPAASPPDNGERIVDYSENPPEEKKPGWFARKVLGEKEDKYHAPGLSDEEIVDIGNQINGEEKDWYIRHGDSDSDGPVKQVETEEQLEDQIKQAKEQGKLPLVIKVHTGNEPFYTDSGAGTAGGSGGWHVVTITDYQPGPPAKVQIDNQWGSWRDHGRSSEVTVHDLFHTMREPNDSDQMESLQKDVDYNKEHGIKDTYKEAELLRLKKANGDLDADEYRDELEKVVRDAGDSWKNDPRTRAKLRDMIHNLPADERLQMLQVQRDLGQYTQEQFEHKVSSEMIGIIQKTKDAKANDTLSDDDEEHYDNAVKELEKIMNSLPEDRKTKMRNDIDTATR